IAKKITLDKVYAKLLELETKAIYIPAENAKFVELINSEDIIFLATESALGSDKKILSIIDTKKLTGEAGRATSRLVIFTKSGKRFFSKDSMQNMEERLKENLTLIRTHTSFIVNMREIRRVKKIGTKSHKTLSKKALSPYLTLQYYPTTKKT
ncbi:LytTR family transcriptional regulator DNA-binding domain-containing protein, partial [Candidatus Riflebacteria bacterium]